MKVRLRATEAGLIWCIALHTCASLLIHVYRYPCPYYRTL